MKTLYTLLITCIVQLLTINLLSAQPNGYLNCADAIQNVVCNFVDFTDYDTDILTNPNFDVRSDCTIAEGTAGKATFLAFVQPFGDSEISLSFNGASCNTSGHTFNVQVYRYNQNGCFIEQIFCAIY